VYRSVSTHGRAQADRFWKDLVDGPRAPHELDEDSWDEAVAALPLRYQRACLLARQAEEELDEESVNELTYDLLAVESPAELEEFIGKLVRSVSRAAQKTVAAVGRTKIARTVASVARTPLARTIERAVRDVGRGVEKVGRTVPGLAAVAKLTSYTPFGALARSTYGAIAAALRGQNIFVGALDGLAGTPLLGALVQVGAGVLRGDNLVTAAKMAVKAGVADVKDAVRLAAMVAPFVPGIGTGVGAALGAADALANGQPITQALIAGVRGTIPGGVVAQAAFDTAAQLAQGKRLDEALLTAARNRLPAGAAQAAFDTGLAIAKGKTLQDAALQAAGRLLPPSPYAADLQAFAQRALKGENLGKAALSVAGQAVIHRVQQQGGDLVAAVQGRVQAAAGRAAAAVPRAPVTLNGMIAASNLAERRGADRFFTAFGSARRS